MAGPAQVSLKDVRLPPYGSAVGTHTSQSCSPAGSNPSHAARQPAPLVEIDLTDGRTLRTRLLVRLTRNPTPQHFHTMNGAVS